LTGIVIKTIWCLVLTIRPVVFGDIGNLMIVGMK